MIAIKLYECRRKKTHNKHFIASSIIGNFFVDSRTKNEVCKKCSYPHCKLGLYHIVLIDKYGYLELKHEEN